MSNDQMTKKIVSWVELQDIAEVVMGQSPPSSAYNDDGTGLPFFQGKTEFGPFYPTARKWCSAPTKIAELGDVLMSIRAPVGPTNIAAERCCIGRGLAAIRPKTDVRLKWLLYAFRSMEAHIDALGTGTTFKAISGGTLRTLRVPYAAIETQDTVIAEIEKQFSRLDEAVANLKRVKANLKRYTDSVYAEVFGDEPNCTLGDLIEEGPQNGLYLPKEMYGEGVPILRIDDYQTAWIRPLAELRRVKAATDQIATWSLREGDLVINRVNSMTHLGKCALIPAALAGAVFESNMMRMRLKDEVSPRYVEHYLASRLGKDRLTENAKWAVNQASINQKDVRATSIFVPDRDAQQEIVADVDRRLSIIKGTEIEVDANIKRAQALRQSVLQRAFSGEITFRDSSESSIAQVEPLIAPHSFPTEPVSVVMAARIIAANCNEVTFGRVKLQKMLYLATHHGQVHAANDEYARKQAGPLDMQMLGGVIKRLDDLRWFREAERAGKSPRDKAYSYSALTKADDHKRHLHVLTPAQQKVIDDLSLLMRTWSTEDCELFATVYAAWNDLILLKHEPTVEAITYEVRENWHESKKRFSTTQVSGMIDKIKRLGYEPTGFGRPTSGKAVDTQTGELF